MLLKYYVVKRVRKTNHWIASRQLDKSTEYHVLALRPPQKKMGVFKNMLYLIGKTFEKSLRTKSYEKNRTKMI